MPAVAEAQVQLRIELDAITGAVTPAGESSTAFVGWLGLIEEVERIRATLTQVGTAADSDRQSRPPITPPFREELADG